MSLNSATTCFQLVLKTALAFDNRRTTLQIYSITEIGRLHCALFTLDMKDWDGVKELILNLYVVNRWKLEKVISTLEAEHGFVAS